MIFPGQIRIATEHFWLNSENRLFKVEMDSIILIVDCDEKFYHLIHEGVFYLENRDFERLSPFTKAL